MSIFTRINFLISFMVVFTKSIVAVADPIISIGTLTQVSQGSHNKNKIEVVTANNAGFKFNNQAEIVIENVIQHSVGNFNQNFILSENAKDSMIFAGTLTQSAYGYMSKNILKVGDGIQAKINISVSDIFQSARNGEVNQIRIGSNLTN